jgi:hypothetical protein
VFLHPPFFVEPCNNRYGADSFTKKIVRVQTVKKVLPQALDKANQQ